MKNRKALLVLLAINILAGSLMATAQKKSPDEIKKLVESKNYVFKAQWVNPQVGTSRQLTSDYDLAIAGDTVISYLPYFGRAYAAPVNPSEGGIKFTSTKFDYKLSNGGKSWRVTIKPKDAPEVQQLYLDIFDNGNATLQVTSTNRQGISFNGYVEENKAKRKRAF
jgi:hypothetical protein